MISLGYVRGNPVVIDYIRINEDGEYIVAGKPYDEFNDAWRNALGMWQRSRYGLPSDNSNMSDAQILASINEDINALVSRHGE